MTACPRSVQNIVRCTCDPGLTNIGALRGSIGFRSKEKNIKTLLATSLLARATASPGRARRAPSGPKQGYQKNAPYNGSPLSEWSRPEGWKSSFVWWRVRGGGDAQPAPRHILLMQ